MRIKETLALFAAICVAAAGLLSMQTLHDLGALAYQWPQVMCTSRRLTYGFLAMGGISLLLAGVVFVCQSAHKGYKLIGLIGRSWRFSRLRWKFRCWCYSMHRSEFGRL